MATELTIRVGGEKGRMVLFDEKAPGICGKILESLPLESVAIIAKVAGLELMMRVPILYDGEGENERQEQTAGNICYWPFSQNICIFCEDVPGLGPVSLIGRITENLEGIQREAGKCTKKQGAVMIIQAEKQA